MPQFLAQLWAHLIHWEGAGLAECSATSPMIAGRSTALMPSCGRKERVKLAPGPKLRAGASLLHKGPCLLDAPQGLAPPCLPQAPRLPHWHREAEQGTGEDLGEPVGGPSALPPNRLLVRRWQLSEQQGFLLEVIPLPQGQAVKLLNAHPKHFLELLR